MFFDFLRNWRRRCSRNISNSSYRLLIFHFIFFVWKTGCDITSCFLNSIYLLQEKKNKIDFSIPIRNKSSKCAKGIKIRIIWFERWILKMKQQNIISLQWFLVAKWRKILLLLWMESFRMCLIAPEKISIFWSKNNLFWRNNKSSNTEESI